MTYRVKPLSTGGVAAAPALTGAAPAQTLTFDPTPSPYAIAAAGNRLSVGGAITAVDGRAQNRFAQFS